MDSKYNLSHRKNLYCRFFSWSGIECDAISLSDQIDKFFSLPLLILATASLKRISVISPVNGNIIRLLLLSIVPHIQSVCSQIGIDWMVMLFASGLLNVRVPCPLRLFGSIVTVSLSKLIVKSIFAGVSNVFAIKISTYPLLVLYAMSRHFSMIKFCSCSDNILAVKTFGLLTT